MTQFTVTRRADYLPEERAITEFRRLPHLSAARRVAHEVAYRFFEAAALLDRPIAHETIAAILQWDGREPINVSTGGTRFVLAAQ